MSSSQSNPNLYSSQDFWEVVEILKESAHRYFVRWAGVDPQTNKPWPDSWVAKEDCTRDLILEWKGKNIKPRGRPAKDSKNKTNRRSRSDSFKVPRYGTPESQSTINSKPNTSPFVEISRVSKRKTKTVDNSPLDTDDSNSRPKKRRKANKEESVPQTLTTLRVGPPGRAKEYKIVPGVERVPAIPYKQRKKGEARESLDSRRSTSHASTSNSKSTKDNDDNVRPASHRRHGKKPAPRLSKTRISSSELTRTRSKSGSANNDEGGDRSSLDIPVIVEKSSSKNGFSQEIIQETTQQQSSSSSQSLHRTSPKKLILMGNGGQQYTTSRPFGHITRTTFNWRPLVASPVESFSPSQRAAQAYAKNKKRILRQRETDPIQNDRDRDRDKNEQVQFDDWLHEKFEEEETQPQRTEEQPDRSSTSTSNSTGNSTSTSNNNNNNASDLPAPTAISYRPRKAVSGGGEQVLKSIFGRLGKVFKTAEPSKDDGSDPIEEASAPSSHPQAVQASEISELKDDDEHSADDDNNALRMVMHGPDEDVDEVQEDEVQEDEVQEDGAQEDEVQEDEVQDIYKSFDEEMDQPEADVHNPVDEEVDQLAHDVHDVHDPLVDEEDQLGPDDAADVDAVGSSIVESQPAQGMDSSLMVQPAHTQQTLQPVIESPVRQLDSALGLLHRKSEEIQQLRDRVTQILEELERARSEMSRLDLDLDRSEEMREAQAMRILQLENELIAARSDAAVKVVQNALGPQVQQSDPQSQLQPPSPSPSPSPSQPQSQPQSQSQPDPPPQLQPQPQSHSPQQPSSPPPQQPEPHPDVSDPSAVATELISTPTSEWLEHLHHEIEALEEKVAEKERENNVFRTLYAQASSSHADNLQELRRVQRENASLHEQARTGVRQANVYWKTQIDALSKKLVQSEATSQLLVQQIHATQGVRDKAALLPVAQKKIEDILRELEQWKDRFAQMGMENTKLRFEVKARDDAELARRREEREAEEENKRLLERENDQLLWICQWRDELRNEKCGAILGSQDELRDHIYRAGHVV